MGSALLRKPVQQAIKLPPQESPFVDSQVGRELEDLCLCTILTKSPLHLARETVQLMLLYRR